MTEQKKEVKIHEGLKSLTLKPTLKCNANCAFCKQRLDNYKKSHGHNDISLSDWAKIIDEAIALGVESVNISGGEPTLYSQLFDLINICKAKSMKVNLKSNGYLIDKKFSQKLGHTKLDSCTISIYSHNEFVHDEIKGVNGSYRASIAAIKYLTEEGIGTCLQTVLTKEMLENFDQFLKWASGLNIGILFLSYLEGSSNEHRPSESKINDFIDIMIPKSKEILKKALIDKPILLKLSLDAMDGLFRFGDVSVAQIAKGIYNPPTLAGCGRNYSMAILLNNGEIHPCNAVEYFSEPVMGDLNKTSFTEAWDSELWHRVKKNGTGWCTVCPMNRHTFIKFKENVDADSFYSTPK
ncbi:MAG: radical SAM protein [bacterium]